jgi:DNA-binding SARP family transcriptional activator
VLSHLENTPLRFEVLGNVRVTTPDGTSVPIGPRRVRHLLAVFLLHANTPLSASQLRELLVDEADKLCAPTVRVHVAALRRCLAPVSCLHTDPDGYRLAVQDGALDLDRFRDLVRRGKRSQAEGDHAGAAQLLGAAAALWPGQSLRDVPPTVALRPAVDPLLEEQRIVLEDLTACQLALGQHRELIATLRLRAESSPLHEHTWAQLILALHRSGRQAEAYEAYARLRNLLSDEYGAEPGPDLQNLYQAILRTASPADTPGPPDSPTTVVPMAPPTLVASVATDRGRPPVPHQLPPRPRRFIGRETQLARLDAIAAASQGAEVIAVVGAPGVGKSALATSFGHCAADRFPDGQLHIDMHGVDPTEPPTTPHEALASFLEALGVPAQRLPSSTQARIGLYRSLLANRRMLLILDNARDDTQVRPLIPAGPSVVVVTSRMTMSALAVLHGARALTLDALTDTEALEYLRLRLHDSNTRAASTVLAEVATRCDNSPMALAITAESVLSGHARTIEAILRDLRDPATALSALSTGDPSCDLRSTFAQSLEQVPGEPSRLFALVGLHPAAELTCAAAASLAGLPTARVRQLFGQLARAHLLAEPYPGHYRLDRLVHAYAAELALDLDSHDRAEALARALDYYVHNANTASLHLSAHAQPTEMDAPRAGIVIEAIDTEAQALSWFSAEREGLLGMLRQAAHGQSDRTVRALAAPLQAALRRTGHPRDLAMVQQWAIGAARRIGPPSQARLPTVTDPVAS